MYIYDSWIEDAYENSIQITKNGIIIKAHVIIEKDADIYSAHCLEFDLVGEGDTLEMAENSIINNIVNYVTFAISKGLFDKIINPAPPEYWNKMLHSKFSRPITIPDTIEDIKLEEKSSFSFLRNLSGKIDSYQAKPSYA